MSGKQTVLAWIEDHQEEVIDFLSQIIQRNSTNPWFVDYKESLGEQEVQEYIGDFLKTLGLDVKLWEPNAEELKQYEGKPGYFEGRSFKGRPNLYGKLAGQGGGRSILLTGHADVVLADGEWDYPPFDGVVKDGKIYGRGAVDMKGGIAAMIMALAAIVKSGVKLKGDVTVGTLADEEAGGMGALDFIHQGYRADAAIMTEPTDLKIAPLCRGILWGKIIVKGRAGHIELEQGSYKTGGAVDAIQLARLIMAHLDQKNKEWALLRRHPLLPMPCQMYIAQIDAGVYPTTFADKAVLTFNTQYLPSERDENHRGSKLVAEIEKLIHDIAQTNDWMRENPPEVEWILDADCAETPFESEFVQTAVKASEGIGYDPQVEGSGFHTDMGWFVNVGIPTINFGPGEPRISHQHNEHLDTQELITCTKIISSMIMDWCGEV